MALNKAVVFVFLFIQVCFGCEIAVRNVGQVRLHPLFHQKSNWHNLLPESIHIPHILRWIK